MGTFLSRNEFLCSLTQQAEAVIKELGDGCSTFPKLNPRVNHSLPGASCPVVWDKRDGSQHMV